MDLAFQMTPKTKETGKFITGFKNLVIQVVLRNIIERQSEKG